MDLGAPDVDALVVELRARVAERRREGFYPEWLEHDLDAHYRRVAQLRSTPDLGFARDALDRVDGASTFTTARISNDSRLPGGPALHDVIGRVVQRQTVGILAQVQEFADATRAALRALYTAIENPAHVHTDLVAQVDSLFEQMAERRTAEATGTAIPAGPGGAPIAFETIFRPDAHAVREHHRLLAARFRGCGPVLDIGCGDGTFLDLLRAQGVEARGTDANEVLVQRCRARGLDATVGSGVDHLAALEPGALGGVALIQTIERLEPKEALAIVQLAHEKVRPGGRVVVVTVNPRWLYAFGHSFVVDPAHIRPIDPEYLEFVFRQAGFEDLSVEWRSGEGDGDAGREAALAEPIPIDRRGPARDARSPHVKELDELLSAPQDYAVVATR